MRTHSWRRAPIGIPSRKAHKTDDAPWRFGHVREAAKSAGEGWRVSIPRQFTTGSWKHLGHPRVRLPKSFLRATAAAPRDRAKSDHSALRFHHRATPFVAGPRETLIKCRQKAQTAEYTEVHRGPRARVSPQQTPRLP